MGDTENIEPDDVKTGVVISVTSIGYTICVSYLSGLIFWLYRLGEQESVSWIDSQQCLACELLAMREKIEPVLNDLQQGVVMNSREMVAMSAELRDSIRLTQLNLCAQLLGAVPTQSKVGDGESIVCGTFLLGLIDGQLRDLE